MFWTKFDPTATFVRASVRIVGLNGVEWLGMALDTGSNRTVLGELAAIRMGYDLLSAPTVRIVTASGVAEARLIRVRQIFALGISVDEFPVLVMPLPTQLRADGLLGLDFLRRRNLLCNFDKGILLTLAFLPQFPSPPCCLRSNLRCAVKLAAFTPLQRSLSHRRRGSLQTTSPPPCASVLGRRLERQTPVRQN